MFSFLWFSHFGLLPFFPRLFRSGTCWESDWKSMFGLVLLSLNQLLDLILYYIHCFVFDCHLFFWSALLWRLLRIWLEIHTALNWFNLSWGKDAANFGCYNAASGWSFMNPFSWRKATCVFNQSVDTGSQNIATKSNRGGFVADINCYLKSKLYEMKLRRKVRHFIVKKFSSSLLTESITIVLSS